MGYDFNHCKIELPERVQKILSILQNAGHEAYVVGGCVRDSLLGRTPGDWDITTSALPLEVKSLFYNTIDTGIQHGTVMAIMGGEGYEITTYRKDGKYSDNRRPDEVEFTPSLEEDLKRRDFTINAFAYNNKSGIVDLFDGKKDLEDGLIRCVGDPDQRFSEDSLRIMRAVRFAAQLSFEIEPDTYQAIKNHAAGLGNISMERIRVEFEKTLMSGHPGYVNRYAELGLAPYIVKAEDNPKVTALADRCFLEDSTALYEQFVPDPKEAERVRALRLAAFFKELTPQEADSAIRALKYDNKTRHNVTQILKYKDEVIPPDKVWIKKALCEMGPETLDLVWEYKTAVMKADTALRFGASRCFEMREETMLEDAKELTEEILEAGEPFKISMLDISGNDIMEAGVPKGEEVGRTLEKLLDLVIKDPCLNKKETLLTYIR